MRKILKLFLWCFGQNRYVRLSEKLWNVKSLFTFPLGCHVDMEKFWSFLNCAYLCINMKMVLLAPTVASQYMLLRKQPVHCGGEARLWCTGYTLGTGLTPVGASLITISKQHSWQWAGMQTKGEERKGSDSWNQAQFCAPGSPAFQSEASKLCGHEAVSPHACLGTADTGFICLLSLSRLSSPTTLSVLISTSSFLCYFAAWLIEASLTFRVTIFHGEFQERHCTFMSSVCSSIKWS